MRNHHANAARLLIPKPAPFRLVRIGGTGDGAYLVPDDLVGIDACFSPGVNNFKNFEDALVSVYGIKCHMCDFSSDPSQFRTPLIKGMQTFVKKWLDIDGGIDSIALIEWIREYSPDPTKDLILQIDIEGAEYRNLLAAEEDMMKRFRIIVIELHELGVFRNPELASIQVEPLLHKLDRTHICVHAHPNNCCGEFIDAESALNIPNTIEVTYLRRDRFTGDQSEYIQPQLPHPQDISWNVRENPPIHLNENWLSSKKRSIESKAKLLLDQLDYFKWESNQLKESFSETEYLGQVFRSSIANLAKAIESHCQPSDIGGIDLANGKMYFLSKPYASYALEGAVRDDPRFFFHTAIEKSQSITIDLGKAHELHSLVIRNRTDACQDRARSLFVIIHDDRRFSPDDAFPIVVTKEFIKPYGPESITPLFGKNGRYLTIFSPIHTAIHFSSIRIY